MKLSLVVTEGNPVGKEIPVRTAQFLIGRDPDCQLRPASPLVSKRHCALLTRGERVFIRDFGSTNGTLLNGQPMKGELEAFNGNVLKIGPLTFELRMVPEAAPVSPSSADTISDQLDPALAETATLNLAKAAAAVEVTQTAAEVAAVAAEVKKKRSAEDDIADLLFKMEGDSSPAISIPGGTTVMSALPPEQEAVMEEAAEGAAASAAPEKAKSNKAKPQDLQATSNAAKAILDKYMRRPRA